MCILGVFITRGFYAMIMRLGGLVFHIMLYSLNKSRITPFNRILVSLMCLIFLSFLAFHLSLTNPCRSIVDVCNLRLRLHLLLIPYQCQILPLKVLFLLNLIHLCVILLEYPNNLTGIVFLLPSTLLLFPLLLPKPTPSWQDAMTEELLAHKSNHKWDLVPRPPNASVIGGKWVYTLKMKSDGTLDRYKARLVAQGLKQEYGLDYKETFAAVAKMTIVCTLLTIVAIRNWPLLQMDVQNAFLHGDLRETAFMKPPPDKHVLQIMFVTYANLYVGSNKHLVHGWIKFEVLFYKWDSIKVHMMTLSSLDGLQVVVPSCFFMLMI